MELRLLRSAPAALAGDQLVAPAGERADDHRLDHPALGDRQRQDPRAPARRNAAAAARDAARSPPPATLARPSARRAIGAGPRSRASSSRPPVTSGSSRRASPSSALRPLPSLRGGAARDPARSSVLMRLSSLAAGARPARAPAPCRRGCPRRRGRRSAPATHGSAPRTGGRCAGSPIRTPACPRHSRTSSATWSVSRLRRSNIVSAMPTMPSSGLNRCCTCSTVCSSWLSPSSAKNSHCSGTSSVSAALSALSVSSPSDGGQSMKHTSCARCSRQRSAQPCSAVLDGNQLDLGTAEVDRRRDDVEPGNARADHAVAERHLIDQHVVGARVAVRGLDAEAGRGVALRIEVDQQRLPSDRGHGRGNVDCGGRLADPTLLVGYGDANHRTSGVPLPYEYPALGIGLRVFHVKHRAHRCRLLGPVLAPPTAPGQQPDGGPCGKAGGQLQRVCPAGRRRAP